MKIFKKVKVDFSQEENYIFNNAITLLLEIIEKTDDKQLIAAANETCAVIDDFLVEWVNDD